MKIYLDDERNSPEGWVRTYTVEETISLIENNLGKVTHVSLDNDLGEDLLQGYKVLDYLEEKVYFDSEYPMPHVQVHSANPVRRDYMNKLIKKLIE